MRAHSTISCEKTTMRALFIVPLLALCTPVLAGPQCTGEPESAWLTKAEMMARIEQLGHRVEVFKKTKGNCYEIYGWDKAGKRIEVYFHPVTGEVIKSSSL
jgi:hypothetical protein